ncbi:LysM peptidoglycan-binding domain-containing protein [Curtobacterium sp. SP.BCo]|uniref:LysM peptidoglycan-binding domain-containing protein n=1 Tax=Curtobacterium sp. SP.BCo TaxID=3435229 RepID=UPI003F7418E1
MRGTHAATTAIIGTVLTGLLLTGCTAFGGDDSVPKPTRQAAEDATAQTPQPDSTLDTVGSKQAVPAGTVVAETDAVSKSGDTRVHVRVVANEHGTFEAHLSGYRTTEPQPMTVEFRRTAEFGDWWDSGAVAATTWEPNTDAPDTVSLSDAGAYPDWLHDVVLVPAPLQDGDSDTRPWVGSVLAVGALSWKIPNPFPDLTVTVGKDRPGAYGYVFDKAGKRLDDTGTPSTYQVAHGDDQTTVAKRFGITVPELRWLNPTMKVRDDGWIYEDTVLNLDPATR